MVILYRDKHGRFISKRSAKRRKPENVLTEIRKTVRGKSLRIVRGYHPRLRSAKPKRKITFPPSIHPKPKKKPKPKIVLPVIEEEEAEEEEEFDREPSYEEIELYEGEGEDIDDWIDFSSGDDDFDKFLERLDDLDDLFDYSEGDFYEEV